MKRKTHPLHRRTLLPVPYSTRPDRLERGVRILRALRASLAQRAPATAGTRQSEFDFAMPKRA